MADTRGGRLVFAEALSEELGVDMDPKFLAAVDKLLARLWFAGFAVLPVPEKQEVEAE